ncbi:MAG: glutaredoxin family protein [Deltaproteobacteria bacterium]|nr:glutaredoxin family protein [Deltaproteobacteria bacterium]
MPEKKSRKSNRKVFLFALSTCIWCRKTKALLDELGVKYDFVDVDLLEGEEKERVRNRMRKFNPQMSFPTIVIDDEVCIAGFDEKRIREELR